jgi:hypothetical protein
VIKSHKAALQRSIARHEPKSTFDSDLTMIRLARLTTDGAQRGNPDVSVRRHPPRAYHNFPPQVAGRRRRHIPARYSEE